MSSLVNKIAKYLNDNSQTTASHHNTQETLPNFKLGVKLFINVQANATFLVH